MLEVLSYIGVVVAGLYLICLGLVALMLPSFASHFLLKFAGSIQTHYIELGLRVVIGCAFLLHAPHMYLQQIFIVIGWTLIVTTTVLFAIPWQWHRRFAQLVVPYAVEQIMLVGIASLSMGVFVVWCAVPSNF